MILILLQVVQAAKPRSAAAAKPANRPAPSNDEDPAREHGRTFGKEDDVHLLQAVVAKGSSHWENVWTYGQKNMKNAFGFAAVRWWEAALYVSSRLFRTPRHCSGALAS